MLLRKHQRRRLAVFIRPAGVCRSVRRVSGVFPRERRGPRCAHAIDAKGTRPRRHAQPRTPVTDTSAASDVTHTVRAPGLRTRGKHRRHGNGTLEQQGRSGRILTRKHRRGRPALQQGPGVIAAVSIRPCTESLLRRNVPGPLRTAGKGTDMPNATTGCAAGRQRSLVAHPSDTRRGTGRAPASAPTDDDHGRRKPEAQRVPRGDASAEPPTAHAEHLR